MKVERTEVHSTLIAERAYRWAIVCGITPLILGAVIFLAWWKTRWLLFVNAGLLNIIVGLLFISFGLIYLTSFWTLSPSSTRKYRRILACLALFASNFVGAAVIMLAVTVIETAFCVEIENQSHDTIRNAALVGGGCRIVFDRAIPPGGTSRRTQWIKHDDEELKFTAEGDHRVYRETFRYYVTSNLGGFHSIVVNADRTVSFVLPGVD